ncbi:MAG TPA: hypothetical protein VGB85_33005, partial [Nannocystis sp.]
MPDFEAYNDKLAASSGPHEPVSADAHPARASGELVADVAGSADLADLADIRGSGSFAPFGPADLAAQLVAQADVRGSGGVASFIPAPHEPVRHDAGFASRGSGDFSAHNPDLASTDLAADALRFLGRVFPAVVVPASLFVVVLATQPVVTGLLCLAFLGLNFAASLLAARNARLAEGLRFLGFTAVLLALPSYAGPTAPSWLLGLAVACT